jgi:hypothetical protein
MAIPTATAKQQHKKNDDQNRFHEKISTVIRDNAPGGAGVPWSN